MKLLTAIFMIALAIVLGGALSGPILERWNDANAARRQLDALQIEREETQLRDWQSQQQATFVSRAAASNLGYLGAGALVMLSLFVGYDIPEVVSLIDDELVAGVAEASEAQTAATTVLKAAQAMGRPEAIAAQWSNRALRLARSRSGGSGPVNATWPPPTRKWPIL